MSALESSQRGVCWKAEVRFYDNGFCEDASTEGVLHTRYFIPDPGQAVDLVVEMAKQFGVEFKAIPEREPTVYMDGDGESDGWYPDNWQEICNEQATRIGWRPGYVCALDVADGEQE